MENKTVKIRLLNSGSFTGMEEVKFPVVVNGHVDANDQARVCGEELINVGAISGAFDNDRGWHYSFGEYELVTETPTYNKKLIDAVNALQGDLSNTHRHNIRDVYLSMQKKTGFTTFHFRSGCSDLICTIEEFNQCVEDMSEIATANELMHYRANNSPLTKENSDYSFYGGVDSGNEFKWGDDVVFVDGNHSEHDFKFIGIDTHNDEFCFIGSTDAYVRVKVERLMHKPEPSDEDIKIKTMFDKYNDYGVDDVQLLNTITDMVNNGDL